MKLTELDPKFLRYEERPEDGDDKPGIYHVTVETLAEAQGVQFLCPKCFVANGGRVGTHAVVCWSRSRGAPECASPGPGRWTLHGAGFDDLTLHGDPVGTARSILLTGGCAWHGFITNGEIT